MNNVTEQPSAAPRKKNGIGTAGFVMALIAFVISWIPVVGTIIGWILGPLGFIFSLIGVFRQPRGLSIAGLIISLLSVILLILLATVIML